MKFAEIAFSPNFNYKEIEMNWIGGFNPNMMKVVEQIGATIAKTHVTYIYFRANEIYNRLSHMSEKIVITIIGFMSKRTDHLAK